MPNPDNIKGQGFHTNPERIKPGRPKGSLNRSTIVRRWIEAAGSKPDVTVADEMVLAQIKQAMKGNTMAFNAIFDSGLGKVVDKSETTFKEVSSSSEDVAKRYVERLKGKS